MSYDVHNVTPLHDTKMVEKIQIQGIIEQFWGSLSALARWVFKVNIHICNLINFEAHDNFSFQY